MYDVTKKKCKICFEIERKQMLTNFHFIFNDFAAVFTALKLNFLLPFEYQQTQKNKRNIKFTLY